MNFIKLIDEFDKTVVINLDLVTYIYGQTKDRTSICFDHPEHFVVVNTPIENLLEAIIKTVNK